MNLPRCFEFRRDDGSGKYWEVIVEDCDVKVRFGKLRAIGQTRTKHFTYVGAAEMHMAEKIQEKTGKGYKEIFVYCKHCFLKEEEHARLKDRRLKCLFDSTTYEVWKPRP